MEKVIIIGGGIVGTAIARELAKYQLDITLVEKEPDFASGATKANSGILHAGFDAPEGSLKARLNVRGNILYRKIVADLKIGLKLISTLVVAKTAEELAQLSVLHARGRANGVEGLEILSRQKTLDKEPNLAADIAGALYAPTGGIMTPFEAALAFAENAARNGAKLIRECAVRKVEVQAGKVIGVFTELGFEAADWVINAGGLAADDISRSAGDTSFALRPRKGEYMLFDKNCGGLVKSVIFPTPSPVSKGIVIAPTVHGNLFIGPNANDVDDKNDCDTSTEGLVALSRAARQLIPRVEDLTTITQFAGLRAVADTGDFVIRESGQAKGLIHVAGIQSPGLTAAPAIAEHVVEIMRDRGASMTLRSDFCPHNPRKIVFSELDDEAKQHCWEQNGLYGRIICRCETVTEAEIVAAVSGPCGAVTLDGVKRRTRAGMGRCQGGFCGPRVAAILARELGRPLTEIRKETAGSYLFYAKDTGKEGGEYR